MDEELSQLRNSVDKQNELQQEANRLMHGLIDALQNTGQAVADLVEELQKRGGKK
jgi:phosphoribosyl-ATP pyrophosphohydrolase